jgi:hypothetical protein
MGIVPRLSSSQRFPGRTVYRLADLEQPKDTCFSNSPATIRSQVAVSEQPTYLSQVTVAPLAESAGFVKAIGAS